MVIKDGEINFNKVKSMLEDIQQRFDYRSDEVGFEFVYKKIIERMKLKSGVYVSIICRSCFVYCYIKQFYIIVYFF